NPKLSSKVNTILLQLTSLRQGITKYGPAPHKPILLLVVIDGFEKGYLWGREVPISEELLTSFHDYWKLLVNTPHDANFSLPFFHLSSEVSGIWQLKPFVGKEIPVTKSNSIKSFRALRETVECAILSDEFAQALQNPVHRNEIKAALLERYFPEKHHCSLKHRFYILKRLKKTSYTIRLRIMPEKLFGNLSK
ncbi:MAG: hypothetical protein Q7W54_07870, partial [Bacteroidota bacterium]|nr:hypothetical protein [Bacteroidota bacterium]